jgi:hypothetical protein
MRETAFFAAQNTQNAKGVDVLGKSPLNYTGNKACIAPFILDIMPTDEIIGYIEPFCGSAELFLQKEPCEREILNDFSGDVMNFWRVVRSDKLALLIGKLFLSVNGEELFRFVCEEIHLKHAGQCKVIITYNDCELVREEASKYGFFLYTQDRLHNMAQHADPGSVFTEVIITNYDALEVMSHKAFLRSREMEQLSLFTEGVAL